MLNIVRVLNLDLRALYEADPTPPALQPTTKRPRTRKAYL